jgi:hypothetical protein
VVVEVVEVLRLQVEVARDEKMRVVKEEAQRALEVAEEVLELLQSSVVMEEALMGYLAREAEGGGGGAPEGTRLPAKGGGTPNFVPAGFSSSFAGVFGGRGGGGGPGFAAFDEARALFGGAGGRFANLPASAIGGGALKTGFGGPGGGEGSRGGDGGAGLADELRLMLGVSVLVRRAGGGAGGGPRLEVVVLPVF